MYAIIDFLRSDAATRFYWNVLYFAIGYVITQLTGITEWWAIGIGALLNGISKEIKNKIEE